MNDRFDKITKLKDKVMNMEDLSDTENKVLREQFELNVIYNSNAIEGNSLTLRETKQVLEGLTISKKPLKDHLDVIGFKEALGFIYEIVKDKEELDERTIKDIHSLVLMNDRKNGGVYREIPVEILGSNYKTTDPFMIDDEMKDLIDYYKKLKKEKHIIEAVSEFHLKFESIHPFIDGNGRTGRLIMNLELMKEDYKPVDIKYTDREKYYDAFDSYHETGAADTLTNLILDYEEKELLDHIERIESKIKVRRKRKIKRFD